MNCRANSNASIFMRNALAIQNIPMVLILALYLPGALVGLYLFRDSEAVIFIVLLLLFCTLYVSSFRVFYNLVKQIFAKLGSGGVISSCSWHRLSVLAIAAYVSALGVAVWLADSVPLFVALSGGSLIDIALARAGFLSGLSGYESIVRYIVFILGKSVVPLVLLAAFFHRVRYRYPLLVLLLFLSMLAMEKAGAVFVLLPLMFYFLVFRKWASFFALLGLLVVTVSLISFLALGGVYGKGISSEGQEGQLSAPEGVLIEKVRLIR